MTTLEIISIVFIGLIILIGGIIGVKKFIMCSPSQRKELILKWLTGAVVAAQNAITEHSDEANKAKFDQVMNEFKTNAPMLYKLFITFTKDLNLEDLIEQALENIKNTEF